MCHFPPGHAPLLFSTPVSFWGLLRRVHAQAAHDEGLLLHPFHNWYLTTSHTEQDIAIALEATDTAFAKVAASAS